MHSYLILITSITFKVIMVSISLFLYQLLSDDSLSTVIGILGVVL